jgi:hypothetical protein
MSEAFLFVCLRAFSRLVALVADFIDALVGTEKLPYVV